MQVGRGGDHHRIGRRDQPVERQSVGIVVAAGEIELDAAGPTRGRRRQPAGEDDRAALGPLADAGVSIFAISTFDTDYLLVKEASRSRAAKVLRQAGFAVEG